MHGSVVVSSDVADLDSKYESILIYSDGVVCGYVRLPESVRTMSKRVLAAC